MTEPSADELWKLTRFILNEMERNDQFTDRRARDEALLFGVLLGLLLRLKS